MSLPILASTVLIVYAVILLAIFRITGFGFIATTSLCVVSTLAVWGSLHLVCFSEFLYTPPVSNFLPGPGIEAFFADPKSIGSDAELSWIPLYFASLGWWFGLVFFIVVWIAAKLLYRLRPNDPLGRSTDERSNSVRD